MAEPRFVSLTWEIGARADFSSVAAVFANMDAIVGFAVDVQSALNEQEVTRLVLQNRRDFAIAARDAGRPISIEERLEALDRVTSGSGDPRVRVLRASYENPLQIHLNVNFDFLVKLIEAIRDWGPLRRQAKASAEIAESDSLLHREVVAELMRRLPELSTPSLQTFLRTAPARSIVAFADTPAEVVIDPTPTR
jgi:hypothetical protein